MKKFKFKSLICAVAALILAVPTVSVPAFANSGPPWEEGVTQTGVHCVHEDSVLQVQGETLTFNINTLPFELQEGEKYDATVTAEYTFKNPTAETVNTQMAFPIGQLPDYQIDKDKLQAIENPITVNGQPIEYTVRHTYGRYNDFSYDVKKIKDDYIQTGFFTFDLPVTEYVFKANLADDRDGALFMAPLPQTTNTRYICDGDGQGNFSSYLYNDRKFSIFVLGEDADLENLDWSVTRYHEVFDRPMPVNGSVSLVEKMPTMTFKNYALRGYDSSSGISEVDWYNAVFDNIKTDGDGVCVGYDAPIIKDAFTEWYVYQTTVEPNGTFTNSVTAPLYPRIYFDYEPDVYEYSYYLSPAKEWAAFGNLTVNINTKHYLQSNGYYDPDDAANKFTKTESGYTATFESLPETELCFSMCSVETPSTKHVGTAIPPAVIIVFCVLIFGLPLVLGVGGLITFLVIRAKRKKKASSPTSARQSTQSPDQTTSPQIAVSADIDDGIAESQEESQKEVTSESQEAANPQAEEAAVSQADMQADEAAAANGGKEYCIYCGSPIDGGAKFCTKCGGAVNSQANQQYVPKLSGESKVNGFGIAGFVVSLSAWIFVELLTGFAFLLAAVGFGLSLAGLLLRKKYTRAYGFAIAGLVISSLMALLVLVGIFLGLLIILGLIVGL